MTSLLLYIINIKISHDSIEHIVRSLRTTTKATKPTAIVISTSKTYNQKSMTEFKSHGE